MMIKSSVIEITKYSERPLLRTVVGDFAEIVGETKTRLTIGGLKSTPTRFSGVAVDISA